VQGIREVSLKDELSKGWNQFRVGQERGANLFSKPPGRIYPKEFTLRWTAVCPDVWW
jgi:hypothetical protein